MKKYEESSLTTSAIISSGALALITNLVSLSGPIDSRGMGEFLSSEGIVTGFFDAIFGVVLLIALLARSRPTSFQDFVFLSLGLSCSWFLLTSGLGGASLKDVFEEWYILLALLGLSLGLALVTLLFRYLFCLLSKLLWKINN